MSQVVSNLIRLKDSIPSNCTLVAVSKTKPSSDIMNCFNAGHLDFGENKVQELVKKAEELPKTIRWHMIGHLQRNKVKFIVPFVHLIHGVDSFKLLAEINKRAKTEEKIIHCLLQVHIAEEESKFGFDREELLTMLHSEEFKQLNHIQVQGLMGMATFTDKQDQVRREFQVLKGLFEELKTLELKSLKMELLSMGMSGDYLLALEEGSNMIRVGSSIFGTRNKN